MLLPVVARRNLEYSPDKYGRIAGAMGIKVNGQSPRELGLQVVEKIEELLAELELPTKLSQLGVKREDIPLMADLAQQDICLLTNPCSYSKEEIEEIYFEAF